MQEVQQPMARLYHGLLGLSRGPLCVVIGILECRTSYHRKSMNAHSAFSNADQRPKVRRNENKHMCSVMKPWQHIFHHCIPNSCITQEYMHTIVSQTILLFIYDFSISSKIQRFSQIPSPSCSHCTSVPISCFLDNKWRQSNKFSSIILRAMISTRRKVWRWQPN